MKFIERQRIRIYYYIASCIAILFVVASVTIPMFISIKDEYELKVQQLSGSIVSEKKRHLFDSVNKVILEINGIKHDVVAEYSSVCKSIYGIVRCAWPGYVPDKQKSTQCDVSGEALPGVSAGYFEGFDFAVTDSSGIVMSSSAARANSLFDAMRGQQLKELFPVVAEGDLDGERRLYVFMSMDQVDLLVKTRVKNVIRSVRLGEEGYVWVNHVLNYNGGDNYAIRLVHPNLPSTEGMFLSTNMKDVAGNLPYKEELEGVKSNGDLYFDYYFKKLNADTVSHKMTYAKLYKPYDWIIATGVYLDDVDALVKNERDAMDARYAVQLKYFAGIVLVVLFVSVMTLVAFEKQINALINSYVASLKSNEDQLRVEKDKVEKAFAQLKDVAYLDYLTGLWNRRAMYERLREDFSRCTRAGGVFCVIVSDIDHFKNINDTYGHACGDHVLKVISSVLKRTVRAEDSISRWGGEEFLIVATASRIEHGLLVAEKLRQAVEKEEIIFNEVAIKVTMTFGVAECSKNRSIDDVIRDADSCLYHGKLSGRNTVVSAMNIA